MYGKSYRIVAEELTIADAISNAFGEISALAEELREWADNLDGGNLGHTEKYQRVDEAAQAFENRTDEPNVPVWLEDLKVTVNIGLKKGEKHKYQISRAARAGNACCYLAAVSELCDDYIAKICDKIASLPDDAEGSSEFELGGELITKKEAEERCDDAEALRDELEDCKDEVDGVEIPGMYS